MATVALLCEGKTDFIVPQAVVQHRVPAATVRAIQPKFDATSSTTTGWTGLRDYLRRKGRDLAALRRFGSHCAVLIQVDADVVPGACDDARERYQQAVDMVRSWAGLSHWPAGVFPVVPVLCLETWIAAASADYPQRRPALECMACAAVRGHMRTDAERQAMARKDGAFYAQHFAPRVRRHWEAVVRFCPQGAGAFERVLQTLEERCL